MDTPNELTSAPSALAGLAKGAPTPLKEALKAQLLAILEGGELTAKMLLELEQTASLAHKMLIVSGDPRAMPKQQGMGMLSPGYGMGAGVMGDVVGPADLGQALAPASYPENFGAESIRNLVSEAGRPRLPELLKSLEIAQKGDQDQKIIDAIQKQIDEQLGLDESEPVADATPLLALSSDADTDLPETPIPDPEEPEEAS